MRRFLFAGAFLGMLSVNAEALQTEKYPIVASPLGWNAVEQYDVARPGNLSTGFFLQFAKTPLAYRDGDQLTRQVVSGRITGDLVMNVGLFKRFELGAALPAVLYQTGEGFNPPRFREPPPAFALGDIRIRPRIALLTPAELGADWGVTLVPAVSFPTGRTGGLAGGEGVVYQPELAVGGRFGDWALASNIGVVLRAKEQTRGFSQDDSMIYRLAGARRLIPGRELDLTLELLGETGLEKPFSDPAQNPVEVAVGVLFPLIRGFMFSASAGPGLSPGIGAPLFRVTSGIRWTPTGAGGPFGGRAGAITPGKLAEVRGGKIELRENVHFLSGSETISPASYAMLNAVSKILQKDTNLKVRVVGHTDERGSTELNQILSEKRAEAVRHYLIGRGINESRLSSAGRGETEPIAPNDTDIGREKNRRVEFLLD